MKTFSKPTLIGLLAGLILAGYAVFVFLKTSNVSEVAEAAQKDKVAGFAWAGNIGWISFNSENDHDAVTPGRQTSPIAYGVTVNDVSLALSGYAWSDKIGWISFNLVDTAAPPAEYNFASQGFIAKYDTSSKELRGWARALGACSGGATALCESTTENAAGWDGWIKLQKHPSDTGASYGVFWDGTTLGSMPWDSTLKGKELEGFAWGSDVVGWVSFNCKNDHDAVTPEVQSICATSNYSVVAQINLAPSTTTLAPAKGNYCAVPSHSLSWTFSDQEDGATQTSYNLEVATSPSFTPPLIAISGTTATTRQLLVKVSPGPEDLVYNTTYNWRVKTFDSAGADSGWVTGTFFPTEQHLYPTANFDFNPKQPSQGEEVLFAETAQCFALGNALTACPSAGAECPKGTPDKCYEWDFGCTLATCTTTSAAGKTATTTYTDAAPHTATFTITDKENFSCSNAKTVNLRLPLPKFKETAPR